MLTIGAPLRKWTPLLLLYSLAALAQTTDDTTSIESTTNIPASSLQTSTKSPSPTRSSPGTPPSTSYESTCAFRTINYLIHTLPQQCLTTTWSPPTQTPEVEEQEAVAAAWAGIPWVREITAENASAIQRGTYLEANGTNATQISHSVTTSSAIPTQSDAEAETETDSLLDSANFLSFEEWKKKNLARAGQSPENIGQGRGASSEARTRRRPVNVNALDALGEESEIDIDFSGFVNGDEAASDRPSPAEPAGADATQSEDEGHKVAPTSFALSKDAGKTCKERFNYASFDCAATVLKTNEKAKSATAVLVENKDSYMLNECSAQNKFIIVELCDDILVDTVVLANYEFFSSMFRHFRVSVSDRYPVKLDRWRVLGTFEARNSRDIQPFLVTEPQIWARYLRIEFLSHYGSEFYCPLSLLRVHGTTMMEQFRREEEQARGDDDFVEPIEVVDGDTVKTAVAVVDHETAFPSEQPPVDKETTQGVMPREKRDSENTGTQGDSSSTTSVTDGGKQTAEHVDDHASARDSAAAGSPAEQPSSASGADSGLSNITGPARDSVSEKEPSKDTSVSSLSTVATSSSAETNNSTAISTDQHATPKSPSNDTTTPPSTGSTRSADSTPPNPQPPSQPQQQRTSSPTQPSPSTPTTQESFYKSIHKRLQQLEANSTLSLQYIEAQSRMLRDAFISVEKRQLAKTEKFLAHLNATVMQELKSYRALYEQLWQSTILELEGMKERQRRMEDEVGTRLGIVADELVWQKRMALVQSTLLLLFFGVVLFVRSGPLGGGGGGGGGGGEGPGQQRQRQRSYGENMYTRLFDISPPRSPREGESHGLLRRRRTFREMWRGSGSQASDTSPPSLLGAAGRGHRRGHASDGAIGASDVDTEGARSPLLAEFESPGQSGLAQSPGGESEKEHEKDGERTHAPSQEIADTDTGLLTPTTSITEADHRRSSESGAPSRQEDRRIEVLATQSGPATPRGSRDTRPSREAVDEAVSRLADGGGGAKTKQGRSPLRRSQSYAADEADEVEDEVEDKGQGEEEQDGEA